MNTQSISVYGVYLNEAAEVLLINDSSSHVWGFPGGSVEKDETETQALKREFIEEAGLTILGKPVFITEQTHNGKIRRFYSLENVEGSLLIDGNNDDTAAAKFFSPPNLDNMPLAQGVKEILEQHHQRSP